MKKTIIALILLISIPGLYLNAQGRPGRSPEQQEKFRSMKIAYFTEQLELTAEEAELFWPVYNAFEKEKVNLHRDRRNASRKFMSESENLSDEQAKELIEQHLAFQKKETKLEIDLYTNVKEFLPPKKIMKMYITEVRFREHILRQLRGDRQRGQKGKRTEEHP